MKFTYQKKKKQTFKMLKSNNMLDPDIFKYCAKNKFSIQKLISAIGTCRAHFKSEAAKELHKKKHLQSNQYK